jgi:predicted 3-demethylubiquinone-9 3-methyltransferase (glyoxalase superfamily)
MANVSTFLWFESQAEAAATLYCSILPDAKITSSSKMSTSFTIGDQRYVAFNGGPHHELSPAVSVFVSCANQAEVDALWDKFLASGGSESRCGWLVDKFGLSWQIIPTQLMELLSDRDPVVAKRVFAAMMTMTKIDIAALVAAHRG